MRTNSNKLTRINNICIKRNFIENLPFNASLKKFAKDKRQAGVYAEVLFWQQVHKGKFHKIDFDRQRIIGNYIVDFYIKALGLIIEIDGTSHDNKTCEDAERQAYFDSLGLFFLKSLETLEYKVPPSGGGGGIYFLDDLHRL